MIIIWINVVLWENFVVSFEECGSGEGFWSWSIVEIMLCESNDVMKDDYICKYD